MDMIVLEEKAVPAPTLFVEKRDGRRVIFDVDKIDKALHKAAEKVMDVTPLVEKRLSTLVERIVEEIHSRFPQGVKIYEIQNIVEHELLEAKEYALAEEYITYRTQRDFERSKATDINFSIHKLLNKDQSVVNENVMDGNVLLVPAGTVGSGTITSLKKARSFGRNGVLDITFDTIPAIDGTEFTAVQGKEAKDKTRNEVKAAGASVAGAVLLGPVGLVGGAFVKGKNIEYPAGATIYVQPQDSVTIQGLVIGGDGLAHSDDELAEAVTVPNAADESEETVDTNEAAVDENETTTEEPAAVEEQEEQVENVSQPIVVVKRNQ